MKNLNRQKDQQQIPLVLSAPPKIQLKNGIVGSNHETLEAIKKFLLSESIQSKSFILWGNQGSGKSFWLQAWANELLNSKYFDLKIDILTEYTEKKILILDNLDLASKVNQTSLFRLFNLHENLDVRIIGSASTHPELIDKDIFREDLMTRLKQGLLYKLNSLSDLEKKDALKEYIFSVGWLSSRNDTKYDSILNYMLQRFPRQLPILKHILVNTNNSALANKYPVTIPLVKSIMEKIINE